MEMADFESAHRGGVGEGGEGMALKGRWRGYREGGAHGESEKGSFAAFLLKMVLKNFAKNGQTPPPSHPSFHGLIATPPPLPRAMVPCPQTQVRHNPCCLWCA